MTVSFSLTPIIAMVNNKIFATAPNRRTKVSGLVLLGLLVVLGGCKNNRTIPANVVGGSMAPNVLGPCLQACCSDCGFTFHCDIGQSNQRKELVCPNCGYDAISRETAANQDSSLFNVVLDNAGLDRWDVVALKQPESNKTAIKRIVGLPGETVTIRNGNLLLGNQLIRKTIKQQKKMMVMVHDSKFSTKRRKRWLNHQAITELAQSSELPILKSLNSTVELDWRFYRHLKCYSHRDRGQQILSPIEDSYGYNQSLSRNLNPTDELFFRASLNGRPNSIIGLRFDFRSEVFELVVDCQQRKLICTSTGSTAFELKTPLEEVIGPNWIGAELKIELSTIDFQINFIINEVLLCQANLPPNKPQAVSICPLAIGLGGEKTKINRLQIWRDIYYLPANAMTMDQQTLTATNNGFLLLGDNAPLSLDSRQWKPVSVKRNDILGVVKTSVSQ